MRHRLDWVADILCRVPRITLTHRNLTNFLKIVVSAFREQKNVLGNFEKN